MYGCESWTVKKAERQRIDALKLWCWRRLLRVHSKGDQLWVFFGRTDAKAETPLLWPPQVKSWLTGKDFDAGRDWGQEEKGTTDGWMASLTRWTWVWVNSGRWWWTVKPGVLRFMGSQRVGHDWATEMNWTEPVSYYSSQVHGASRLQRRCKKTTQMPSISTINTKVLT